MDIHVLSGWTAVFGFIFISIFTIYKYTKQNRDLKW